MFNKVVITGMGVVSCLGHDVDQFWKGLLNGQSGIKLITKFDTSNFATKFGGEINNFDPLDYMDKKESSRTDLFDQYAMAASVKALEMAGLNANNMTITQKENTSVLIGSGMGGMSTYYGGSIRLFESGPKKVKPSFITSTILNMPSGRVAKRFGFMGMSYAICSACATSAHAIMAGFDSIRFGRNEIVIAGGAEGALEPLSIACFNACKALSINNDNFQTASRPFDVNRNGFVIAEGAGILVMESEASAKKRGAHILAEIAGVGASSDAYDDVHPRIDAHGVELAISRALSNAQVGPDVIDYINTHGTSTQAGDVTECLGTANVLGEHKKNVILNSTKSLIGHSLGAAGAIEAVVCVKSLMDQKVHVSANIENVDPLIDIPIARKTQSKRLDYVLSNSFGFGGHNCSVLFKKYEN